LHTISKKGLAYSLPVVLGLIIIFYFGWRQDQNQLREARVQTIESTAGLLKELIEETVNENLLLVANHKARVEFTKGEYFNNFEFETNLLLNVKDAFLFFEWIDADGEIIMIEPYEGNSEAIGLDILELDYRRNEWLEMKSDSTINMTPWTELAQGGGAFLVDAPLYYNDQFHGSLTVGMDFTDAFEGIMAGRDIFNLEIWDENGQVFFSYGFDEGESDENYSSTQTLHFISGSNNEWKMRLTANENLYSGRSFVFNQLGLFFRMLIAVLFGFTIYFMMAAYRANRRNLQALKEKEVLISEIHHRVKNNLAVISSLIDLQRIDSDDPKLIDSLQTTQNRIQSIAGVHELLYHSDTLSEVPFEEYLNKLMKKHLDVYDNGESHINVNIDSQINSLNINQALPLGILMSELVTNSFKHAFNDNEEGEIKINISGDQDIIRVYYSDNGPGFKKESFETSTGLGVTIIRTLLGQLHAEYELDSENGFKLRFTFKRDDR
jgi:two-component sensor histidine kinase